MYMAVYISIDVSKNIVPKRGTPSPKKKQLYDWTHLRKAAKAHGHLQAELTPNAPTKPSSFEIRDTGMSNKETWRAKLSPDAERRIAASAADTPMSELGHAML